MKTEQFTTIKEVVEELLSNKAYHGYIIEILEEHFEKKKYSFESWKDCFNGK